MRILLQSRENLWLKPGGDTRQIEGFRTWLLMSGHHAEISLVPEVRTSGYDIVHIHGIMRPHETWAQLANAKQQGTPVVVSPCYQDLALYNRMGRYGAGRLVSGLLRSSGERLEWMRLLGMGIRNPIYRKAASYQRKIGFTQLQRRIVASGDGMVFSSTGERDAVTQRLESPSAHTLIPNGIEPAFPAEPTSFLKKFGLKHYVLCAGRIEDLKNQLRLLSALRRMPLDVVLAGACNPRHARYTRAVTHEVSSESRWHYVGHLSGSLLRSCYAGARVHVQPSWFENFGLSTVEALSYGIPAVLTSSGYAGSHFEDAVSYCDPANAETIAAAIENEMAMDRRDGALCVKPFEWPGLIPEYIRFYSRILDASHAKDCDVL